MIRFLVLFLSTALLLAAPPVRSQLSASTIESEIGTLRSLSDSERPTATIKLAEAVQALPAGERKLSLADALSNLVTEGDQGVDALQAVADALAKSLAETTIPVTINNRLPMPYMNLARLARYEHVKVTLSDPLYTRALETLAANDADVERADFTLNDLHNKPWTLSQLRGKVVLVNFWATWCPPCRAEMPSLDAIYTQFGSKGLVVLSITDEDSITVGKFLARANYHPPVLIDSGDAVHKRFHIEGIPHTYVFDRDGKLVGVGIDQCTQQQFFRLLSAAGLKPQ